MTWEYTCPDCGSSVLVPDTAAVQIDFNEEIGCNNTEEHEDGEPLVMWGEKNDE